MRDGAAQHQYDLGRHAVEREDPEGIHLQRVLPVEQVAPCLAVLFRRREAR